MVKEKESIVIMNKPVARAKVTIKKETGSKESNKQAVSKSKKTVEKKVTDIEVREKLDELADAYNNEVVKEAVKRSKVIKTELQKAETSFMRVAFNLKWFKDKKAYLTMGYETIDQLALKEFGIKKATTYNFLKVVERFGLLQLDGNITELQDDYKKYTSTKLITMASLTDNEIKDNIKPDMSVAQIKKVAKRIKDGFNPLTDLDNENEPKDSEQTVATADNVETDNVIDSTAKEVHVKKLMTFESYEDFEQALEAIKNEVRNVFSVSKENTKITINSEWV